MRGLSLALTSSALWTSAALGQTATPIDTANAFGAREAIFSARLSPDGTKIAYLGPGPGPSTILYSIDITKETAPHIILRSSGDPERLLWCDWVANDRLACNVGGYQAYAGEIQGFTNVVAINDDGSNIKVLSKRQSSEALNRDDRGGRIIDLLPNSDGIVLMTRFYAPEGTSTRPNASTLQGGGVDQIDTRTMAIKHLEKPWRDADEYISDGLGNVRVMGLDRLNPSGYSSGLYTYMYRSQGSSNWLKLSDYDARNYEGFDPYVVDPDKNVVYGFEKRNSRQALMSVSLENSALLKSVVLARDDVDIDSLIQIGKRKRVVGASYATERRHSVYFDPALNKLAASSLRPWAIIVSASP